MIKGKRSCKVASIQNWLILGSDKNRPFLSCVCTDYRLQNRGAGLGGRRTGVCRLITQLSQISAQVNTALQSPVWSRSSLGSRLNLTLDYTHCNYLPPRKWNIRSIQVAINVIKHHTQSGARYPAWLQVTMLEWGKREILLFVQLILFQYSENWLGFSYQTLLRSAGWRVECKEQKHWNNKQNNIAQEIILLLRYVFQNWYIIYTNTFHF